MYRELNLKNAMPPASATEIMYEVASARADGVQLLRFNVEKTSDQKLNLRGMTSISKTLKRMKLRGVIQFFALPDNFSTFGTESRFLLNKYPDVLNEIPEETDETSFFYIKL